MIFIKSTTWLERPETWLAGAAVEQSEDQAARRVSLVRNLARGLSAAGDEVRRLPVRMWAVDDLSFLRRIETQAETARLTPTSTMKPGTIAHPVKANAISVFHQRTPPMRKMNFEGLWLVSDDLLHEKAVLHQELQHRVANSLQIIASVLLQSARRVTSEDARGYLVDAHSRVMSVAALQRQLAASADWALTVADDGIGMTRGAEPAKAGLGTSIVQALAKRVGARVDVVDAKPGTKVSVVHDSTATGISQKPV